MKRFLFRIVVCLVPTLISLLVVGVAYWQYQNGKGGFTLGVDLVGGTILVYEVDVSKTETRGGQEFKPEMLAEALKKRIDPNDLYNITIRPIGSNPPRVEIILPTGGKHQMDAEKRNWEQVLNDAWTVYPVEGVKENTYSGVRRNDIAGLVAAITRNPQYAKDADKIALWIENKTGRNTSGKERRMMTGDEVERIKTLIGRQGRLEFCILANTNDDKAAIDAAKKQLADPAMRDRLASLERSNDPPPAPRNEETRSDYFPVTLPPESQQTYRWVEVGKSELYSLRLNSSELQKPEHEATRKKIENCLKTNEPFEHSSGGLNYPNLMFVREITEAGKLKRDKRDINELKKTREFFFLVRNPLPGQEITGDELASASPDREQGKIMIRFRFKPTGAIRFGETTSRNCPPEARKNDNYPKRQLAIIFDGQVVSAPSLQDRISDSGQITGNYTETEVNDMVRLLRAGALPATLKKDPVSQNSMGATLGADTIRWGSISVFCAFLAVMVFMVFYYRFAGIVACIALFANLLLTVAFMVVVQAAFTLPGLAGLVLTLGMAVDANVLIYERLREERDRGASLSLALRNGYDRAFPTILDTHLSSIFTAIVLYVVGNDQLKGFGISLTVGLIISLFTSLYMTRTMFEIWLAKGWLKDLNFFGALVRLLHSKFWDFMSIRYTFFTITVLLTLAGAGLFIWRADPTSRSTVLNIDFTGGVAFTGQLMQPLAISEVRDKLEDSSVLPDMTVEQLYVSSTDTEPTSTSEADSGFLSWINLGEPRSRFFSVRTTNKDQQAVLGHIQAKLGTLLKQVRLKDFKVVTDKAGKATSADLFFTNADANDPKPDFASPSQVQRLLAGDKRFAGKEFAIDRPADATKEKDDHYSELTVRFPEPLDAARVKTILEAVQAEFNASPQPERLEVFDSNLAENTRLRALYAVLASWAAILLYLWFRFGNWTFGAAAVLCLIHDLFFTLGAIAICHYVHMLDPTVRLAVAGAFTLGFAALFYLAGARGGQLLFFTFLAAVFASVFIFVGDFKVDLATIAALLTLVGYSVNDTIVVFDRIREIRGKNPALTPHMINDSVNQTLTRTILASATVLVVVLVLYYLGGEGVKLFAFVMIVGVFVGTYSSIYIAAPLLLMFGEGSHAHGQADRAPVSLATES